MIFTTITIRLTETEFAINCSQLTKHIVVCEVTDLELSGFQKTVIGLRKVFIQLSRLIRFIHVLTAVEHKCVPLLSSIYTIEMLYEN